MPRTRLVIITVSAGVVAVLLAIATNIAASALPESWQPHTWLAWPAVFLLTAMIIGLSVWQVRLDRPAKDNRAAENPAKQAFEPDTSNRDRMLAEVRRVWIDGYLKHSLDSLVRIELGLEETPDAVSRPWDAIVQQPGRAPRPLPPGQAMGTTFDELGQALLILGAPGAGKTTLLLELTRDLLDRAVEDAAHPIPVVFHLASWAVRRRPLADWLVDELSERYYVPRKVTQGWADAEQVLPLLDGLDEVAPEHRTACVEAINTFRRQHAAVPLAVCSRAVDYEALPVRVELSGAIVIQPLSRAQIGTYLKQAGKALAGVRTVLQDDDTLWELLPTPLMLSIVALAYQGQSAAEVRATGSLEQRRAHLFANYTRRMLERRSEVTAYTPEQTLRWLTWLARSLIHNNLSIFFVEWMQPDWLPSRAQQWIISIVPIIIGGLVFGLIGGLVVGLVGVGLTFLLLLAASSAAGLAIGFGQPPELVVGPVFGLVFGLASKAGDRLVFGLFVGMEDGLDRITPAESLRWSWRKARNHWVLWLAWLAFTLSFGLGVGMKGGLVFALESGLVFGLAFGLISGLTTDQMITRTIPNEGIRRSLRTALISLLIVGLGAGLSAGLIARLMFGTIVENWLVVGLDAGLAVGLVVGLVVGLRHGGFAYLKHYALRFLLWRNDYAPLNYIRFLDHAAERVFLHKVGGGYIFTHRLLMEYIAALPPASQAGQTTPPPLPSNRPPG